MQAKEDYYDVKKVSASSLAWFERSPLYFKMMLDKEIDESKMGYFIYGDMVHKYILEPQNYKYLVLDYDKPTSKQQLSFCSAVASYKKGKLDDKLIRAYKAAYKVKDTEKNDAILAKAKKLYTQYKSYVRYLKLQHSYDFIFSSEEDNKMKSLLAKVKSHKKANELLYQQTDPFGQPGDVEELTEFEIYWTAPNGVECKSKLDRLVIDYKNKTIRLIDLKTTSHLHEFKDSSFISFKYYRQLAFYWLAITWLFIHEKKLTLDEFMEYEKETYIVAISKGTPVEVKVFNITDNVMNDGLNEIDKLLDAIKWHQDNNKWDYDRNYYAGDGAERI